MISDGMGFGLEKKSSKQIPVHMLDFSAIFKGETRTNDRIIKSCTCVPVPVPLHGRDLSILIPCLSQVQWLAQNFNSETNIPIATDTDTQNAYKYQIDKPAANNWRLRVQNVQESDMALYICRVQLGGQQSANDSRILVVNRT